MSLLASLATAACSAPTGTTEPVEQLASELNAARFGPWTELSGKFFNSGPAVARVGASIMVCGTAQDKQVWCNSRAEGFTPWLGWNPTASLQVISRPSVAYWLSASGSHHPVIAAQDSQQRTVITYTQRSPGGPTTWVPWTVVPGSGAFSLPPALVVENDRSLVLFGVKADQRVYWSRNDTNGTYVSSNWRPWEEVPGGGLLAGAPAAVYANGRIILAGRGTDNRYYFTVREGGAWTGRWIALQTTATWGTAPAVATRGGTHFELFGIRSGTNTMSVATVDIFSGGFDALSPIPNGSVNTPAGAVATSTQVDVVARGLNNAFFITTWK